MTPPQSSDHWSPYWTRLTNSNRLWPTKGLRSRIFLLGVLCCCWRWHGLRLGWCPGNRMRVLTPELWPNAFVSLSQVLAVELSSRDSTEHGVGCGAAEPFPASSRLPVSRSVPHPGSGCLVLMKRTCQRRILDGQPKLDSGLNFACARSPGRLHQPGS